jgi:tRNA A-37 threonylcarbamoyl transferase component Bud32
MADENRCPQCGALHAAGARPGLCLRCLMLNALENQTALPADETKTADSGLTGSGLSLEGTEPAAGVTREYDAAAGPDTIEERGHASSDLTTDLAGMAPTADGNDPPRELTRGSRVRYFGDYEIKSELGRGGMGVVYQARQVSLNRPVALKMIRTGVLADLTELRRFQNEAEAAAVLDHAGIVPVYEVGEHDGQKYFSMKLVEGRNLAEQLGNYTDNPRAAATLVAEAADAVHHAHMRGILHRDLKPANILIDTDGHPHVTDFGLAKRVEADPELTASGMILGTPAYMSPEQARGHRGTITTATDAYGLGTILYALLAGKAPFGGESVIDTIEAVRNRAPEPPSRFNAKVSPDLETICLKCLEKDPRRRYAGVHALADDLRAWLDLRPISARRVGVLERTWLWCKRRPAVAALSAAALLASIGGTAAVIAVQANANAQLKAANQREKQRFGLAMDAIKLFHGEVSEDVLMKEKRFEGLRKKLLSGAARFYGRLEELLGAQRDGDSREALAKAYVELGELTDKIGDQSAALQVYLKALAVQRALASEPGADPARKLDVARSLTAAGGLNRPATGIRH